MAALSGWSTGVMALDLPRKNWDTSSLLMLLAACFGLTTTTTSARAGAARHSSAAAARTLFIAVFIWGSLEYEVDGNGANRHRAGEARAGLYEQAIAIFRLDAVDLQLQRSRGMEIPAHANAVGALAGRS